MSSKNPYLAKAFLDRAESYFRAYSFNNKKELIDQDIVEAFENSYLDIADLIVCGFHSRKKYLISILAALVNI